MGDIRDTRLELALALALRRESGTWTGSRFVAYLRKDHDQHMFAQVGREYIHLITWPCNTEQGFRAHPYSY